MQGNAVHSDHLSDISILIWRGDHHHGRPCHPRHPHSRYWHSSDHLSDCLFAETVLYLSFDKLMEKYQMTKTKTSIIFILTTPPLSLTSRWPPLRLIRCICLVKPAGGQGCLGGSPPTNTQVGGGMSPVFIVVVVVISVVIRIVAIIIIKSILYPQNTGRSSGRSPASASPLFEFPNTQTSILVCWKQAHWYLAGTSFVWKDTNQCHHRPVSCLKVKAPLNGALSITEKMITTGPSVCLKPPQHEVFR